MRWLKFLLLIPLFISFIILEEYLRARATAPIPVNDAAVPGTIITAASKPDFLWAGRAWWIHIDSPIPIELEIDSARVKITEGKHRIFWNHDVENLSDYGILCRGDYPTEITARPIVPVVATP